MPSTEPVRTPGSPVWIDVTTSDLDATTGFFAGLLGWQPAPSRPEFGGYTNMQRDGELVAGLAPAMDHDHQPVDGPDRLTVYLATDDLDETLSKVTEAGGSVQLGAMDVADIGRMAVVADPQGNPVGLWQAGSHLGFGAVNQPGFPTWFELRTPDPEAAVAFFSSVFGLHFEAMPVSGATYHVNEAFGIFDGERPGWLAYFWTDDAKAATEQARAAGATVLDEPSSFEFGVSADLQSPQGCDFGLFEQRRAS